jgi:anhydro-N-acetylmuramic acid kinase
MSRAFLGISFGSALESVDAAIVRTAGVGLALAPRIERIARVPLSAILLDSAGTASPDRSAELGRGFADAAVQAIRGVAVPSGLSLRDVFGLGLLEPANTESERGIAWSEVAGRIVESTGLTAVHGFRDRDRSAGGSGQPIAALPDFMLFHHAQEDRLLIHLGAVTSLLFLPAHAKVAAIHGFEASPGYRWLNAILFHGTRGKEQTDVHGKIAVQGRCLEPLLKRWLDHPYFARRPPKSLPAGAFNRTYLQASFDMTRHMGAGLPDLLCTANHLIARAIGDAWRTLVPPSSGPLRVLLTGGGTRNGFLWQLLGQQFEGLTIARTDEVGAPSASRKPAAAAILAALTCDGVVGNLAPLTGAAGGRLLGHIIPGDARNWAQCSLWLAEQAGEYPRASRAA